MKCTLVKFPKYAKRSSFVDIVKIGNTRISNQNDVDRGYDCEVRRGLQSSTSKLNLIDA